MPFAEGGQQQSRLILETKSLRLLLVQNDREQILQGALRKGLLPAAPSRQKDQPARLLFDQPFDEFRIVLRQLILAEADVAQEDHIITRQEFFRAGKRGQILLAAARGHAGMKQQTMHFHTGSRAKAFR